MGQTVFHLRPVKEYEILEFLNSDELNQIVTGIGDVHIQLNDDIVINESHDDFQKIINNSLCNFQVIYKNFDNNILIKFEKDKVVFPTNDKTKNNINVDSLVITTNGTNIDITVKLFIFISEYLRDKKIFYQKQENFPIEEDESDALRSHYKAISSGIAQLASETSRLITERSIEIDAIRSELEQKKKLETDNELVSLRNRQSELSDIQKKYEQKLSEVNDRENTHVRRELYKEITDKIQTDISSFTLTPHTKSYETKVHIVFILFIISTLILAIAFNYSYFISDNKAEMNILLLLKSSISIIGFVLTLSFYIRWIIKLYDKQALSERTLKQTQIDIARASWLVETLMEWRKNENGVIPSELLAALSRNLFQNESKEIEVDLSPADQLASALLGSASKLKINTGVAELEWDGKKVKDLEKK
jgi:hypothetical protein